MGFSALRGAWLAGIAGCLLMPASVSAQTLQDVADKIQISGFMTAAASRTTSPLDTLSRGVTNEWQFDDYSNLGLQLRLEINDSFSLVNQTIARGVDDFDVENEWAYLQYAASENLSVRAGRLRYSPFLISEYSEVGFAYPWVSPPDEVYATAQVDSYEGVDVTWSNSLDNGLEYEVSFSVGSDDDSGFVSSELNRIRGVNITLSYNDVNVRLGHVVSRLSISDSFPVSSVIFEAWDALDDVVPTTPVYDAYKIFVNNAISSPTAMSDFTLIKDQRAEFTNLGMDYDNGSLLVMAELSANSADEAFALADIYSGYVTLGYHVGSVMPHVTFSRVRGQDDDAMIDPFGPTPLSTVRRDILRSEQDTLRIGVRWDVKPNVALKAEVDNVRNFNNTNGYFMPMGPIGFTLLDVQDVHIFRLAVNAVF